MKTRVHAVSGGLAARWTALCAVPLALGLGATLASAQGFSFQGLGHLHDRIRESAAYGVSTDGSVIVGWGTSGSGTEAFRWTDASGWVGLGDLPGGTFYSIAWAVSADGSVVVGSSRTDLGDEAFVWDVEHGMRNLKSVLVAGGLDLTGWTLSQATGVSADGLTIVGVGVRIATVANSGSYTDHINLRGRGTYGYVICDAATSKCSNEATVVFQ